MQVTPCSSLLLFRKGWKSLSKGKDSALPVVGTERRRGQSFDIVECAFYIIAPTVANCHRVFHFGRGKYHFVSGYDSVGFMETVVGPGYDKTFEFAAFSLQSSACAGKLLLRGLRRPDKLRNGDRNK